MTKKIITSLLFACSALGIQAESKYMTVELTSGTLFSFLLESNPVITYEDNSLLINKDAKTTYALDQIKNYHFTEDDQTAVEMFSANALRIVKIDEETIEVQNAQAGTIVTITAVNGMVMSQAKADSEGKATVKLPNQKGVYVVTAGNKSFKIIRNK